MLSLKRCCPWCGVELRRGLGLRRIGVPFGGAWRVRPVCPECGEGVREVGLRGRVFLSALVMVGLLLAGILGFRALGWERTEMLPVLGPLLVLVFGVLMQFCMVLERAPLEAGVVWALPYWPRRDVCPWCGEQVVLKSEGAERPGFWRRFLFWGSLRQRQRCGACDAPMVLQPGGGRYGGGGHWLMLVLIVFGALCMGVLTGVTGELRWVWWARVVVVGMFLGLYGGLLWVVGWARQRSAVWMRGD